MRWTSLWLVLSFLCGMLTAYANRSGCHRWHSCPPDRGTYTCGDLGYCSQCPDNQYCIAGRPRSAATRPPAPTTDSSHAVVLEFNGKVVGVTDADTITVMHGQVGEKIPLNGIDCPEKGQAYGKRAKQAASALVYGKEVTLQTYGKDKYGLTLAYVLLPYGTNVNHTLVKHGWCW